MLSERRSKGKRPENASRWSVIGAALRKEFASAREIEARGERAPISNPLGAH
jgi:hypothetical protein